MKHIETIHFCGGLGGHQGRDIQPAEALAISLAAKLHPKAEIFLHTAYDTWANYRQVCPRARRVQYEAVTYSRWPNWLISQGIFMADRLRMHVLLSCQSDSSLYLDTDAYCTQNLDWLANIEGLAMARLGPFMVANGFIYQGKDKRFLTDWYDEIASSLFAPKSFGQHACRFPHELNLSRPGLTVLDCDSFHGASGDAAMRGYWADMRSDAEIQSVIDNSYIVHPLGPLDYEAKTRYQQSGSAYSTLVKLLTDFEAKL